MTGVAATLQRTSESFERGNVNRKIEKGSANTPEKSKGPYFAEYDVTVPAGGRYQLDVVEQEMGAGTADIHVNGLLESAGLGAVTNREASPDAGGWSVAGVYELKAGKNVIRLEHKNRYPYEAFTPTLFAGAEAPKSIQQVARQYSVNPGYLTVGGVLRDGRPYSVLLPLFAYEQKRSRGDALAGWTSAAIERFRGYDSLRGRTSPPATNSLRQAGKAGTT